MSCGFGCFPPMTGTLLGIHFVLVSQPLLTTQCLGVCEVHRCAGFSKLWNSTSVLSQGPVQSYQTHGKAMWLDHSLSGYPLFSAFLLATLFSSPNHCVNRLPSRTHGISTTLVRKSATTRSSGSMTAMASMKRN